MSRWSAYSNGGFQFLQDPSNHLAATDSREEQAGRRWAQLHSTAAQQDAASDLRLQIPHVDSAATYLARAARAHSGHSIHME